MTMTLTILRFWDSMKVYLVYERNKGMNDLYLPEYVNKAINTTLWGVYADKNVAIADILESMGDSLLFDEKKTCESAKQMLEENGRTKGFQIDYIINEETCI